MGPDALILTHPVIQQLLEQATVLAFHVPLQLKDSWPQEVQFCNSLEQVRYASSTAPCTRTEFSFQSGWSAVQRRGDVARRLFSHHRWGRTRREMLSLHTGCWCCSTLKAEGTWGQPRGEAICPPECVIWFPPPVVVFPTPVVLHVHRAGPCPWLTKPTAKPLSNSCPKGRGAVKWVTHGLLLHDCFITNCTVGKCYGGRPGDILP